MKKFFATLIAVLVSVIVLPQIVFAADVPSFRALDSEKISLTHKNYSDALRCTFYVYECAPNTAENFIKQFTKQLVNTGLFEVSLAGQFKYDNIEGIQDEVYFKYKGSKKVKKIYGIDLKKHNLKIEHSLDQSEYIIVIAVPDGMSYADENAPVVPSTQPSPVENNPVQNLPATNNGADVPDFEQIGNEIVYHNNQRNGDKSITYIFKAGSLSESRADEYVNKYISLLTSNNFVQTGYDKKKFDRKRVQATRQSETWTFDYKGSKSIWALSDGNALTLKRVRDKQTGDTSFEIRIANGLTFAGKYDPPKPIPEGAKECIDCRGTGKCSTCGGTGYYGVGNDYNQPCGSCRTSGKCSLCDGKGYR